MRSRRDPCQKLPFSYSQSSSSPALKKQRMEIKEMKEELGEKKESRSPSLQCSHCIKVPFFLLSCVSCVQQPPEIWDQNRKIIFCVAKYATLITAAQSLVKMRMFPRVSKSRNPFQWTFTAPQQHHTSHEVISPLSMNHVPAILRERHRGAGNFFFSLFPSPNLKMEWRQKNGAYRSQALIAHFVQHCVFLLPVEHILFAVALPACFIWFFFSLSAWA